MNRFFVNTNPVKPFLRWAGGKQNLIKHLLKFVPKNYDEHTYIEPFLGAGSMFFALEPKKAILSDLNVHLMNCYKMIRKDPMRIHYYLQIHHRNHSKQYYYRTRDVFNKKINSISIAQASRFIYLNKTCFNGIFRVNESGLFNVPYGKKVNPSIVSRDELIRVAKLLREAKLFSFSYEKILIYVKKGDFIYLDPPYPPLNMSSSFAHYTKERFGEADQLRLSIFAKKLKSLGCNVLISNADTAQIKRMYKDWYIYSTNTIRYISCKSKKQKVRELIILSYKH